VSLQEFPIFRVLSPQYKLFVIETAPAARSVRLAVISEGLTAWPLYVAQSKRFFEKEGIGVQVTLTGSSMMQLEQLTQGGFDIGFQQSDHVVRGVEQGSDLFIFMAQAHAPDLSLVVAPGVMSLADLRGKVIAVDGSRTGYALLLRKLLSEKGLSESDVVFREFGGSRERFDALKKGAASASLLNPPFDRNLFAAGFGSLGAINEFYPAYPGSIAAARRSWARDNPQQLIAFIRAFNAGYDWLKDPANSAEAIALLPARLDVGPEAVLKALERFAKRERPSIKPEGLRQVIDVVWNAESYPPPKGSPEKYMDSSYLLRAG
jgi:ABC-type nitrate/sulfonate/bicarbonate transport system substrate-binding protein